jgi:site-specific DNA-adenine methylase
MKTQEQLLEMYKKVANEVFLFQKALRKADMEVESLYVYRARIELAYTEDKILRNLGIRGN